MEGISEQTRKTILRIVDANANRCAEGLRVIEEIARFVLEDEKLQRRVKDLRHMVREGVRAFSDNLPRFRDVDNDPGSGFSSRCELTRSGIYQVARSNFSRTAEGLRVIEEFGKLIDPDLAELFKKLRFQLYGVEKDFLGEVDSPFRLPDCPFLYVILDRAVVGSHELQDTVESLVKGGVDMIQYRAKGIARAEMEVDLFRILSVTSEESIPVLVNDDPSIAAEVGAQGVHLGADDPSVSEARSILGENRIIGVTVHTDEEFESAVREDADYISVGAVFQSATKPEVDVIGLEKLRHYVESSSKPVVAIGGICADNVDEVLSAGVCGVAVISAVFGGDVFTNCTALRKVIDDHGKME